MNTFKIKYVFTFCVIIGILLLVNCGSFFDPMERVESLPQLLDIVYRNTADTTLCEAAPGDTLMAYCYYGGDPITSVSAEKSFDVIYSAYGEDTAVLFEAVESQNIDLNWHDQAFSQNTDMFSIRIPVPDDFNDVIRKTLKANEKYIQEFGVDLSIIDNLIDLLPYFGDIMREGKNIETDSVFTSENNLVQILPLLLPNISMYGRLQLNVNDGFISKSDFGIRYNRLFTDLDFSTEIKVNKNPIIHFAGIHKIKGKHDNGFKVSDMDPSTDTTIIFYLDSTDGIDNSIIGFPWRLDSTILIDKGYTYYMAVDSGLWNGVDLRDTALSVTDPTPRNEIYNTLWWYKNSSASSSTVKQNDRLYITASGSYYDQFLPPQDSNWTESTIWIQLYDWFLGESNRPYGSDLQEMVVKFRYSEDYIDEIY